MIYVSAIAALYVFGGLTFAAYNVLEISSLHKQHEMTRDKNSRNAHRLLAKSNIDDIKSIWRWPAILVVASIRAFRWAKEE